MFHSFSRRFSIILIISAPFILFSPVFLSGKGLFWGTPALQFYPWRLFAWNVLRDGHIPLWNPLVGMGAPLVANYQSALFYPPNWIFLLFAAIGGNDSAIWIQTMIVAAHLSIAGLGMYYFMRSIHLDPFPSTVGALSFSLSGYLVSRAGFFSINSSVAWLPWILLAVKSLIQSPSRKGFVRLSLLISLQLLSGHAQTTWYSMILAGLWAIFWMWNTFNLQPAARTISLKHVRVKTIGYQLAALTFGIGLASIQLIPTFEYLAESQRANAVHSELAFTYSFWPWRLLGLIFPNLYGSPITGDYWGYGNYWEDAIYIGTLSIFYVLVGILSVRQASRIHKKLIIFMMVLAGVSVVLALGKNTPVFPWLYNHVPTFNMFQAPTRISIWLVFSFSILASMGTQYLHGLKGRSVYWVRLGTAGMIAVIATSLASRKLLMNIEPSFFRSFTRFGVFGTLCGIFLLMYPTQAHHETSEKEHFKVVRWQTFGLLLLAIDLLQVGVGLNPGVNLAVFEGHTINSGTVKEDLAGHRIYLSSEDEYEMKFMRFFRFDDFNIAEKWENLRTSYLPNIPMLDNIATVNNFDPIVPARYSNFIAKFDEVPESQKTSMMNLMDVGLVERMDQKQIFGVRFDPVSSSQRFRWYPCAQRADTPEQALELLFRPSFNAERNLIIETTDTLKESICTESDPPVLHALDNRPNKIEIQVSSAQPGYLLLSETYYPGWKAQLDGKRIPLYIADYLFKAVSVPRGSHVVSLIYQPASFLLGLSFSSISGLALILIWFYRQKTI